MRMLKVTTPLLPLWKFDKVGRVAFPSFFNNKVNLFFLLISTGIIVKVFNIL